MMKTKNHLTVVNPQKKLNIMENSRKISYFGFILSFLILSLTACQENIVEPNANDTPTYQTEQIYPITDFTTLPETGRPDNTLSTRGDLADIDDVPAVRTGSSIHCHGTPYECKKMYMDFFRKPLKPGQRVGVQTPVSLDLENMAINHQNCYRYYSQVGVMDFCGYIGKDREHPLNIETNGNYRIQVSALSNNRNLDVFVFKHRLFSDGRVDTTVVAYSTLPAGHTETLHLTEAGYYTIVVDEKVSNPVGSDYILSVSKNTPIKTTPILRTDGTLVYQFSLVSPPSNNEYLIGWSFKKKISRQWVDLGSYGYQNTFIFSCSSCDYLVSPVYQSTIVNATREGSGTLIRP